MVDTKWRYWQLFDGDGELAWVAISKPDSYKRVDRVKFWTLMPGQRSFIANWFVSADHQLPESERQWVHDSIDGWDFCDAAVLVPEPSADDARRLSRPETLLTIDQIDRVDLAKVVGKREAQQIVDGRAERRA